MPRPIQPIMPASLPPPQGHYVPGLLAGDLLFISGQLPGQGSEAEAGSVFADQARQAIAALLAILREAGGTAGDLLKVTVYLVGVEHWAAFNAIYAQMLGAAKPARAIVPVPALHHGYLVEIEAIASISR
ncbi:RidA family protein [Sphingobium aquiterrae]|uniref:RidA family protein n=1 Tax=Sphingobium aquiterrae TaxID=2038656 RepID=UPI00301A8623